MSRLSIFVSTGCVTCERAREIARSIDGAYPGVQVELVEIDRSAGQPVPEAVVAVPAYLLDGVVVSLGNPRLATLRDQLAAAALSEA